MPSSVLVSAGAKATFAVLNGTPRTPREAQARVIPREPASQLRALSRRPGKARQIPDELWDKHAQDIQRFLEDELALAESERGEFVKKIARWKLAYNAPMPDSPKDYPIKNASNLTVPVIKEIVNTLAAQLVQVTMTNRPRWTLKDLAKEWEPFMDEIETFMDLASDRDLKLDEAGEQWIIETAKLGTGILEIGHVVDERNSYRYTADGARAYPKPVIFHDGPKVFNIPLEDFWIRFNETNEQDARWCGTLLRFNERTLQEKSDQGKFFGVDRVLSYYREDTSEPRIVEENTEKTRPAQRKEFPVFKIWISWDIDGDGRMEELLLYYNRDAKIFLSRQFNPYWHGMRPFIPLRYFPHEHRFYGEGLCEMLEQIQAGISTKHNQRSDNATLANAKMIIKKKLMRSLQPGDPMYGMKVIEANDIWNDIREFTLSEIYPSTVNEELIMRQYAERISGSNEAVGGSAMPVSRTTASAQLALLQEQFKRIDLTVRSIRRGLNQVAQFTLLLYFQFGVNGKGIAWLGDRGRVIEALFRMPARVTELGFAFRASTPTSMQNRQVKRENQIALFNLMTQTYERLLPLAAQLAPDSLAEVANALVSSARHFLENVLETFEETDPDAILAGLAVLERVLPAPEDLGGLEAFNRRADTSALIEKLTRLEDLATRAQAARQTGGGERDSGGNSRRMAAPQGVPGGRSTGPLFGGTSVFGR